MPTSSASSQGPFSATGVTTFWVGNARSSPQVDTLTVTAVVAGATLIATVNGKVLSYLVVSGDTTATAASGWQALLSDQAVPPEFAEITFSATNNVLTATGPAGGMPFTLTVSVGGTAGAAVTRSSVAGTSPSDVSDPVNWIRNGQFQRPQDGDDVVVADSSVPLLYNLGYFPAAGIRWNSYVRRQDFTGTIGLPENNPAGYYEYRPTYLGLRGNPSVALPVRLGQGPTGTGPGRERYDLGSQQTTLDVAQTGAAQDAYAVRFLGTNPANLLRIGAASVAVAVLPAEVAALGPGCYVGPGGTLALGPGCTVASGATLTAIQGSLSLGAVGNWTVLGQQGSQVVVEDATGTLLALTLQDGSRALWRAAANITTLVLQTGSVFDKSQDARALTVTNCSRDGDADQVLDPYNAITYSNPTVLRNAVQGGPWVTGPGRSFRLS